jgi:uncharacterized protein
MRPRYTTVRLVLAALPVMLLLACQSAPTRTYTLYATPGSASKEYGGPALRVDSVHMPATIDRIEIMLDVAPGELKISDFDHWSAPLGEMARQTLSQDLILRMPPGKVIFPHLLKPNGALGITVDILNFRTDRGDAQLTASWTILPQAADAASRGGSVSLSTPNSNGGALDTVRALSTLLGQLADRIVAGL